MALLVAFHGEDPLVATRVAVLSYCPFERSMQPLETVFQDVVETDQQRQSEVATSQF